MPYVSSIERIGWQEGKQEGRQQERQEIIRNVLSGRFSAIDEELEAIIALLQKSPLLSSAIYCYRLRLSHAKSW